VCFARGAVSQCVVGSVWEMRARNTQDLYNKKLKSSKTSGSQKTTN